MNYLRVILMIPFIAYSLVGIAVNPPSLSFGARFFSVQDYGHSSLLYQGAGWYLEGSNEKYTYDFMSRFNLSYGASRLEPKLLNPASFILAMAKHQSLRASFGHQRNLFKKTERLKFMGGGLLAVDAAITDFGSLGNNPIGYDAGVSINPWFTVYYLNNTIGVNFSANFPLVGYSLRPKAKGFFPTENGDFTAGSIFKNGSFHTVDRLFYIHTALTLTPYFRPQFNRFKLRYEFRGGVNKTAERRGNVEHTLGIVCLLGKRPPLIMFECPVG